VPATAVLKESQEDSTSRSEPVKEGSSPLRVVDLTKETAVCRRKKVTAVLEEKERSLPNGKGNCLRRHSFPSPGKKKEGAHFAVRKDLRLSRKGPSREGPATMISISCKEGGRELLHFPAEERGSIHNERL